MIDVHVFGASTPAGRSLPKSIFSFHKEIRLHAYSRLQSSIPGYLTTNYLDFSNPKSFAPASNISSSIWVSFAPIWLFSQFLDHLYLERPEFLDGVSALIACSSSSAITKRFAFNSYDRSLVSKLCSAENTLLAFCNSLNIHCKILRPTLVYGRVDSYGDKNISLLIKLMRFFPLLPVPATSGLRQPIHASQLASVASYFSYHLSTCDQDYVVSEVLALGGDSSLTYENMLISLQNNLPLDDRARLCQIFPLPNRIFFLIFFPLMLFSPRIYEALLRLCVNLSGFTTTSEILRCESQAFPVHPIY